MKKEMVAVLGIIIVILSIFMTCEYFNGRTGSSDSIPVVQEEGPHQGPVTPDTTIHGGPTFQEINSQIEKLEKMPWNRNRYKDIHAEIAANGTEGNKLMDEKETREITKKLELSYIITLDAAFQKLLNGGRSAIYDFPPVGNEIKKYGRTPYRGNVDSLLSAVNDLEALRKIEDEISTASGLKENDIEAYYQRTLQLEGQPFFHNKALPREMIDNCKSQLSNALAEIQERTLLRPLRLYVQEREYQQDSTSHYESLLKKSIAHPLLSKNNRYETFYREGLKDLTNQEDSHKRFENWVEYRQSENCDQIFGKFQFYVNKCKEARNQGF